MDDRNLKLLWRVITAAQDAEQTLHYALKALNEYYEQGEGGGFVLVRADRLAALERLWTAAQLRKWEWYASPRDEFEQALDDLARLEVTTDD